MALKVPIHPRRFLSFPICQVTNNGLWTKEKRYPSLTISEQRNGYWQKFTIRRWWTAVLSKFPYGAAAKISRQSNRKPFQGEWFSHYEADIHWENDSVQMIHHDWLLWKSGYQFSVFWSHSIHQTWLKKNWKFLIKCFSRLISFLPTYWCLHLVPDVYREVITQSQDGSKKLNKDFRGGSFK